VRALWYVLIGVVVAIGIESHDVVISEPDKALAESDAPIESKRIPVGDYTPSKNALSYAEFQCLNLLFGINPWDRNSQNFVLMGTNNANASSWYGFGQWKREIWRKGEVAEIRRRAKTHIVGRRAAIIDDGQSRLVAVSGVTVLRNDSHEYDREIGAALQFSNEFLPVGDFTLHSDRGFDALGIFSHRVSDFLHSGSRPGGLVDGRFKVTRMLLRAAPQPSCGAPESISESRDEDSGDGGYSAVMRLEKISEIADDPIEIAERRHFVSGLIFILGCVVAALWLSWRAWRDHR
jgi:hypothetical protein